MQKQLTDKEFEQLVPDFSVTLEKCPNRFCDSPASLRIRIRERSQRIHRKDGKYYVYCTGCGLQEPRDKHSQLAADGWNALPRDES